MGRVYAFVVRLVVRGEYNPNSVLSQPEWGLSDSRPGVSHAWRARVKFSRLSETDYGLSTASRTAAHCSE